MVPSFPKGTGISEGMKLLGGANPLSIKKRINLADDGKPAKFIRMDNSGENKKFVERAESSDWKLNLV